MPNRHLQILQWDLECMLKSNVMECLQDDASIQHLICDIIVDFLPTWASYFHNQNVITFITTNSKDLVN